AEEADAARSRAGRGPRCPSAIAPARRATPGTGTEPGTEPGTGPAPEPEPPPDPGRAGRVSVTLCAGVSWSMSMQPGPMFVQSGTWDAPKCPPRAHSARLRERPAD